MISKKGFLLFKKSRGHGPAPPALVFGHCLLIYSIFISFIFLCKYNCKIDHKTKNNSSYKKLTNKRKNHCK